MNFWVIIEYFFNYKYKRYILEQIKEKFKCLVDVVFRLDEEMLEIKDEIKDV